MSEFDSKARTWDMDQKHVDRARAIAAEMQKHVKLVPGMNALEYGAGTGLLSFLLRDKLQSILLMDNSKEMISVCNEKIDFYNSKNIIALHYDLENHDYPGRFDLIFSQMVLHHVKDPEALLQKFHGMLSDHGQLVIADLYGEDGSFHDGDEDVHKGFNPSELLESLLAKGFSNGSFTECYKVSKNDRLYPIFLLVVEK